MLKKPNRIQSLPNWEGSDQDTLDIDPLGNHLVRQQLVEDRAAFRFVVHNRPGRDV